MKVESRLGWRRPAVVRRPRSASAVACRWGTRLTVMVAIGTLLASCADSSITPTPAAPAPVVPTSAPLVSPSPSPSTASPATPSAAGATATPASPSTTPASVHARWDAAGRLASVSVQGLVPLGDGSVLAVGDVSGQQTGAERWSAASSSWAATEGLNKQRTEFALVALQDGRALVVGGLNDSYQSYSSAYTYDPGSGHWSKVGLMAAARSLPAAAVLADGRVLVAGGYFGHKPDWGALVAPGAALAAYDVASDGFGAPGGSTPDDIAPPNVGNALATAELFDPATGEWSATGTMRYARYGAQAVTLADGRVLVVGSSPGWNDIGISVDGRAFDTAELYDPGAGRFTLTGSLPPVDATAIARQGAPKSVVAEVRDDPSPPVSYIGTLIALADGDAILVGSRYTEKHGADYARSFRYHAGDGTWTEIGETWMSTEIPTPPYRRWTSTGPNLSGAAIAALPDGSILAAGGSDEGATTVLAYDPGRDEWGSAHKLPDARTGATAVGLADGTVLVVGGQVHRLAALRYFPRQ